MNNFKSMALSARVKAINKCAAILAECYNSYESVLSYSETNGPVPLDKFIDNCVPIIKRTAWAEYDYLNEPAEE